MYGAGRFPQIGPIFPAGRTNRRSRARRCGACRVLRRCVWANVGPGVLVARGRRLHRPLPERITPSPGPMSSSIEALRCRCAYVGPRLFPASQAQNPARYLGCVGWNGRRDRPDQSRRLTWRVGILVTLERRSVRTVSCVGSRCCTMTNDMPVSLGSARRSWVKASRPPADAPIPTIGKRGDASSGPTSCRARGGGRDRDTGVIAVGRSLAARGVGDRAVGFRRI